jgi:hypothetical protein
MEMKKSIFMLTIAVLGIAAISLFAVQMLSQVADASIKIPDASGAMQACLDSGYTYQKCRFITGDSDLNICGPLGMAGVGCPIQR